VKFDVHHPDDRGPPRANAARRVTAATLSLDVMQQGLLEVGFHRVAFAPS